MFKDRLIMKFVLLHAAFYSLFLMASSQFLEVFRGDSSEISTAIIIVYILGVAMCARRVWQCSLLLNAASEFRTQKIIEPYRRLARKNTENAREILRVQLSSHVRPIEYLGYTLVTLGFFGTVWGFKIALSGVDVLNVGDVSTIGPMVAALVEGMGIALNTTILGVVGAVMLGFSVRLLESGNDKLYMKLLEYEAFRHETS